MLANGMLYSRIGTVVVATVAYKRNIPVVVLCESIKLSGRVLLDSFFNELGSPDVLINMATSVDSVPIVLSTLKNWQEMSYLNIVHALYDGTPPDFIKRVLLRLAIYHPAQYLLYYENTSLGTNTTMSFCF